MAEETVPDSQRFRLEKLTERFIDERRKRRGESVRRILGMPSTDPSVSEMAEYNKAMAMHMKEITAFQNQIFDSERERVKQRAVVVGKMLDTMRGIINTRAAQATGMAKERLRQSANNLDSMYSGLELAAEEAEAGREANQTMMPQDELEGVALKVQQKMVSDRYNEQEAALFLHEKTNNPVERAAVLDIIQDVYDAESDAGMGGGATFTKGGQIRALKNLSMQYDLGRPSNITDAEYAQNGVDPDNATDREYADLGYEMIMDPERVAHNFMVNQARIDNTQASYGGSMGASMAELAGAMTGTGGASLEEALQDVAGELGLSDDEAALMSNQERHKEVLLGHLYNPNAPPAVTQARDQLLTDPGFLSFKEATGIQSDRAAFRALRKQFRKDRRERVKGDKKKLKMANRGGSASALNALETIQQNVRRPGATIEAPSAQAVQPASPQDTIKTGGTIGGQTGK
mgnify:CR=1 FL=1